MPNPYENSGMFEEILYHFDILHAKINRLQKGLNNLTRLAHKNYRNTYKTFNVGQDQQGHEGHTDQKYFAGYGPSYHGPVAKKVPIWVDDPSIISYKKSNQNNPNFKTKNAHFKKSE